MGTEITGAVPVAGGFLRRLLRGGEEVTGATLTRFYGIHVAVLPALTTLCLGLRLFLVQKHGMSVPLDVERREGAKRTMPFFPNFLLRDLVGWLSALALFAALAAGCRLVGAALCLAALAVGAWAADPARGHRARACRVRDQGLCPLPPAARPGPGHGSRRGGGQPAPGGAPARRPAVEPRAGDVRCLRAQRAPVARDERARDGGPDGLPGGRSEAGSRPGRVPGSGHAGPEGCLKCHRLRKEGGSVGIELTQYHGGYDSPVGWATTVWNHAPRMAGHAARLGVLYPRFAGDEMVNLLGFLRSAAAAAPR